MNKTCPKCGREIDENSIICMYCGHSVSDAENISKEIEYLKEMQPTFEKKQQLLIPVFELLE